jgi:membrane protein involved in colicin uptake
MKAKMKAAEEARAQYKAHPTEANKLAAEQAEVAASEASVKAEALSEQAANEEGRAGADLQEADDAKTDAMLKDESEIISGPK